MVMSRVASVLRMPSLRQAEPATPEWHEDPVALYRLLRAYYHANDLYAFTQLVASERGIWAPAMKGLRNPAHRVVEFYVAHLWPEEFKVETEHEGIKKPIDQVWQWSNWDAKQRLAARWFSMLGDLFIKVVSSRERQRVWLQIIDPEHVVDFDRDERGFVTYLHMEVPKVVRDGDTTKNVIHTEIWDKATETYRRWERDRYLDVADLGRPAEQHAFSDFGIDFVPFVHAMFQDAGNVRGAGAFTHALDKIDEANQQATRLHQMLFRNDDALWALAANAMDPSGRPMPPPRIEGAVGSSSDNGGVVKIGALSAVRLPGMATLVPLVPNLHYGEALAILNGQLDELERDLPELAFHRIRQAGDISGRAARMMMTDAIDKILEARANGEQALVRADQMALSMGAAINLEGFAGLGDFDSGALDHDFAPREPIAISEFERWEAEKMKAEAAISQQESGISVEQTLRDRGYSKDEIADIKLERDSEQENAGQRLLRDFDRGNA